MGKLLNFWLLKKLLVLVHRPLTRLCGLALGLWLVLAMLDDVAKAGLLPLWLFTFIKWGIIFAALAAAVKQYKQLKRLLSRIKLGSVDDESPCERHQKLLEKTVLKRRKEVIAEQYRSNFNLKDKKK